MAELTREEIADRLRGERFTTKEDLLMWIKKDKQKLTEKSKTDKKHSAAFYYAYIKMLERFYKKIEGTILFNRLEDFWYYSICISSKGASLDLEYTSNCHIGEQGGVVCQSVQSLELLKVPGKFLSVDEYAEEYGVGAGTVRQWIRRGKIRSAIKIGKEWIIPELTEMPGRGYQSAVYQYNGSLSQLPEEYNFLNGYTVVLINQDYNDKRMFNITVAAGNKTPINMKMNTKEREKLELFLISSPEIMYVEGPTDGLNISFSNKETTNDWTSE